MTKVRITPSFTIASALENPVESVPLDKGVRRIKTRPFLFMTTEGQLVQFEFAVFLVPPQELRLSSCRAGDNYEIKASMLAPRLVAYKFPNQDEVVIE